jgi:hypothetical protein
MNRVSIQSILVAVVALFVMTASPSALLAAFIVNGDINDTSPSPTYSGLAAAPDAGANTYWNGLSPTGTSFTSATLKASSSNGTSDDTGITFSLAHASGLNSVDFGVGTPPPGPADLMRDIVYNRATQGAETFSFANVPVGSYDLYFYSVNGFHQSSITQFTITTGGAASATATNASASGLVLNNNYVVLSGLAPIGGVISGTILDASGVEVNSGSSLNGFQLVQVPEPASLGMLVVAAVMTLRQRRFA